MDQWAFFDELKSGTVRNVYCFYGPEAFIRRSALEAIRKKVLMPGLEGMNETVLSSPSAQQIIESCETLPMMSDYRLIIVRDCMLASSGKAKDEAQESALLCEYLSRVPETTCLVFDLGDGVDKRKKLSQALMKLPGAVSFDALDDVQLGKWVNQQLRAFGKRMDKAAVETLAFTSGRDLTLLSGELQKLAAYAGERAEGVRPARILQRQKQHPCRRLVKKKFQVARKPRLALQYGKRRAKVSAHVLVAVLQRHRFIPRPVPFYMCMQMAIFLYACFQTRKKQNRYSSGST